MTSFRRFHRAFLKANNFEPSVVESGKVIFVEKFKKSMSVIDKCLFSLAGYRASFACDEGNSVNSYLAILFRLKNSKSYRSK